MQNPHLLCGRGISSSVFSLPTHSLSSMSMKRQKSAFSASKSWPHFDLKVLNEITLSVLYQPSASAERKGFSHLSSQLHSFCPTLSLSFEFFQTFSFVRKWLLCSGAMKAYQLTRSLWTQAPLQQMPCMHCKYKFKGKEKYQFLSNIGFVLVFLCFCPSVFVKVINTFNRWECVSPKPYLN